MAFDNNKLGELRPNQIITTFGPGSIVDAVKDSVTVLDTNYWREKGTKIIDGCPTLLSPSLFTGISSEYTTFNDFMPRSFKTSMLLRIFSG